MRQLKSAVIQKAVAELCIEANTRLRPDVLKALGSAYKRETKAKPVFTG